MSGDLITFPLRGRRVATEEALEAAGRALLVPISERLGKAVDLQLEDPELLLSACDVLRSRLDSTPSVVRDESEFFFQFLRDPKRPIGHFDEREYFLGEFALLAGTASRILFHRDDARRWFTRAEANFVLTENGTPNIARLAYQKLALAMEERRLEEVLEAAPLWADTFTKLGMVENALKCLFLEGAAYREMGETPKAVEVFQRICKEATVAGNVRLLAVACGNLAQFHRVLGDLNEALVCAQAALPLLQQTDNRVNLAKLRWCVGDILREQGKKSESLDSYRSALRDSEEIGIRGDVAALHLVIADLLLDAGLDRQAEWEVRAALPIIDEEQMVPEGFAALGLLRESLRRRQIDRGALRELHGYFPQG